MKILKNKKSKIIVCLFFVFFPTPFLYCQENLNDSLKSKDSVILLEEIKLTYFDISKLNLGIDFKKIKKYTPAERKYSASSTGVIGLINLINGNLKILRKNIEIEKEILSIEKLETLFDDEFYLNELKISRDYIKGFLFYIVEDKKFLEILENTDINIIKFEMLEYSIKYNNLKELE